MTRDVIPKAENTNEIIQGNLLKYTFIRKRQIKRRHVVPAKYRNNLKSAIVQLEKERDDIVHNLNATYQDTAVKQDERYKNDIYNLNKRMNNKALKFKYLKEIDYDLTKQIDMCVSKEKKNSKIKTKSDGKLMYRNVEEILLQKTRWFNKGLQKQIELRNTLNGKLQEITEKNKIYKSKMLKLHRGAIMLNDIGESTMKAYKERQQALNDLSIYQNINDVEMKQLEKKLYLIQLKLKIELGLNEFLIQKCTIRGNEQGKLSSNVDIGNENIKNEGASNFIRYLVHISGNKDLSVVTDIINNLKNCKESLFPLCVFYEQLYSELNTSSLAGMRRAVAEARVRNRDRRASNEIRRRAYDERIQANGREVCERRARADLLTAAYRALAGRVRGVCRALRIGQAAVAVDGPPDADNIGQYAREMERRADWLMYTINCLENSCLMVDTEDPLTSDAESTPDLTAKDLDGVKIKMRKVLDMDDPSTLVVPDHVLDVPPAPSPCPHCVEARFIESGYCNLLNVNEMITIMDNSDLKLLCCAEMIVKRDLKNMSPELGEILHDKSNCKRSPLKLQKKKTNPKKT